MNIHHVLNLIVSSERSNSRATQGFEGNETMFRDEFTFA
jgi:hypothetical protein